MRPSTPLRMAQRSKPLRSRKRQRFRSRNRFSQTTSCAWEDGKRFKSLKRHLRTTYDMTPEQYRAKWGLPARLSDGGPRTMPQLAPNGAPENLG